MELSISNYKFVESQAHRIAHTICSKEYNGYTLTCEFDFMHAKVFFQSKSYLKNTEQKCIGMLLYDFENDIITLRKTCFEADKHEHHKSNSLAVSYDLFKHLRIKDRIEIHEVSRVSKKCNIYKIGVRKATDKGQFRHYQKEGYELQFFIGREHFRVEEQKVRKTKRIRQGK
ncbi:MAG: hypothetical protein WCK67_08040 [bacterium]